MNDLEDLRFPRPIKVTRPTPVPLARYRDALPAIWESDWYTNLGPQHQALERALGERLETPHAALFSSGTTALIAALAALDLPRGAKVLTTPFTFPATVDALHWCGLEPVFADVSDDTFNLDPRSAATRMSPEVGAILAVHCYGVPCDVDGVGALAAQAGVPVVYDAAPAYGVRHRGRPLATFGDVAVLSFHATKLMSTVEGGATVCRTRALHDRMIQLRSFGMDPTGTPIQAGLNGKLSELHAAFGLACLSEVDGEIALRRALAAAYHEGLADIPGIRVQTVPADTEQNHGYFPIRVSEAVFGRSRDAVWRLLASLDVHARRYFFPLCSDIPPFSGVATAAPGMLPVARRIADEVLCLPLHGGLTADDVGQIVEALRRMRR